jgi:NTP pyrophosphatase (non-canonical NTP hydrolase)
MNYLTLIKRLDMDFNEYQNQARKTAVYPDIGKNWIYPTYSLSGEIGELQNLLKKVMRGDYPLNQEVIINVKKELGDVLWYLAMSAFEFNLSLDEIAKTNLEKLYKRQEQNKVRGNGDNR